MCWSGRTRVFLGELVTRVMRHNHLHYDRKGTPRAPLPPFGSSSPAIPSHPPSSPVTFTQNWWSSVHTLLLPRHQLGPADVPPPLTHPRCFPSGASPLPYPLSPPTTKGHGRSTTKDSVGTLSPHCKTFIICNTVN